MKTNKNQRMKIKTNRLEAVKMILSSQEIGSQSDLLKALEDEGFQLTQATLSRDLKQLKVAKAASMNGKYVYVLPNETMYRRVKTPRRQRDAACQRFSLYKLLWKHGSHQDPSGLC